MRKFLLIIIIFTINTSLFSSGNSENYGNTEKLFIEGNDAYRENNFHLAYEKFQEGAMAAHDSFVIASFYYNTGNSAFKIADSISDKQSKRDQYETAIYNFKRCLEFDSDFESAIHNGELALVLMSKLEQEIKEEQDKKDQEENNKQNSSEQEENPLQDLAQDQYDINEETSKQKNNSENGSSEKIEEKNKQLSQKQHQLSEKTDEIKEFYPEYKDSLEKISELQKQSAMSISKNDISEAEQKQQQILGKLQEVINAMNEDNQQNEEGDEAESYIKKLESTRPILYGIENIEVERDW